MKYDNWMTRRLWRDPWREYALCLLLKRRRLSLPALDPGRLLAGFDHAPIQLSRLSRGSWSSPVTDVVILSKLVRAARPRRVLELGSFRGYTALAIAENLEPEGLLVCVDIEPQHGEAYRDTALAARIERRVGPIGPELFPQAEQASYDLIFLDADHRYAAVKSDTETTLGLLKPGGYFVWHDYANWGYFSGACGVPEYLADLSAQLPVAHIAGSNMAIHSPSWSGAGRAEFERLLAATAQAGAGDHWGTGAARDAV